MRIVPTTTVIGLSLVAAILAAPASATQFTYQFNSNTYNGNTWSTGSNAGVLSAKVGSGTDTGLSVTTTGYTAVKSGSNVTISTSSVYAYDGGLGVVGSYDNYNNCGVGGCGMHQIDNVGNTAGSTAYDFVQLTFSKAVTLVGLDRVAFAQTQNTSTTSDDVWDDDASYGRGATVADGILHNANANTALTITGAQTQTIASSKFSSMLGNTLLSGSNATTSTGGCSPGYTLDSSSVCYDSSTWATASSSVVASSAYTASTTWWISAALLNPDNKSDAFKLFDFRVVYNDTPGPVPEPASWMTMIAGFGLIGSAIRRKKAAERLAAA